MIARRLLVAGLCLAFLCVLPVQAADLYKWVDENGTVHFGENPPPGVKAVPVSVDLEPAPAKDPYPDASSDGEPSAAEQQRQARAERRQAQREEAERIAAQCAQQQQVLDQLEPRPNVLVQNEDGTTTRMNDDERLRRIEEARSFIRNNCRNQ